MAEIKKTSQITESKAGNNNDEMQLDDARRVKVLSPGMLVFKRFIRNRLAVIGFGILLFMFIFAFFGPLLSPYGQTEVFKGMSSLTKDYAGAIYNTELRYTVLEGNTFGNAERAQFLFAVSKKLSTFTSGDSAYFYTEEGEGVYRIMQLTPVVEGMLGIFKTADGQPAPADLVNAYQEAVNLKVDFFELDGVTYRITANGKMQQICTEHDLALASLDIYDAYNEADAAIVGSFGFKLASSRAIANGEDSFVVDGLEYNLVIGEEQSTVLNSAGDNFAEISTIIVNPIDKETYLDIAYKSAVRNAIISKETTFLYPDADGNEVEYDVVRVNTNYYIKRETATEMIRMYENPSAEHLLGLDNNGMDVMTRLMFGGRVSLLVGFVVIFIEVFIGIIIGGLSGYFGGWVDTALMRFVDLFNSIPFYPMVLIFGSVMDTMEVKPMERIFILMAILGILGWTGVARIVRGQILSLRELDFMVATEATGIRVSRRIFKHLIPNVMPLLIVYATAGLGGVIITEATLGFLGLGIKYPLASWGSIINVASDAFVMTNYWFMWIPAGTLILLTVLGFNFVGDGLRDAYDPKMKR